jgi:dTMP kinase
MLDFHRRVREGFLAIAKAEPHRVRIVDAQQPFENAAAEILSAADELIRVRCP